MGYKQTQMIKKEIALLEEAIKCFTINKYTEVTFLIQFKVVLETILKADKLELTEETMNIKLTKFVFQDAYDSTMNSDNEVEKRYLKSLSPIELKKFAEKYSACFGAGILNMEWDEAFSIVMEYGVGLEMKKKEKAGL